MRPPKNLHREKPLPERKFAMTPNRARYFTTGEFARAVGTTKETLFHYDETGVFSPELRAENGYRYYSLTQIEVFNTIAALKQLGMPLEEIRRHLANRTPAALVALLEHQRQAIGQQIRRLQQLEKLIDSRVAVTRQAAEAAGQPLALRYLPAQRLAVTACGTANAKRVAAAIGTHMSFCQESGILLPAAIGETLRVEDLRRGRYETYDQLFTPVGPGRCGGRFVLRPAGEYLVGFHTGGYPTLSQSYRALLERMDALGLEPAGPLYEQCLLDELSVKGYENYLLQLALPVRRPGGAAALAEDARPATSEAAAK